MNHRTVEGIIESFFMESGDSKNLTIAQTVQAVSDKINRMPLLLKVAMSLFVFAFNVHGFIKTGKFFHGQTAYQRNSQIMQWRRSSIRPLREFIAFYEKLAFFVYFSKESAS